MQAWLTTRLDGKLPDLPILVPTFVDLYPVRPIEDAIGLHDAKSQESLREFLPHSSLSTRLICHNEWNASSLLTRPSPRKRFVCKGTLSSHYVVDLTGMWPVRPARVRLKEPPVTVSTALGP